MAILPHLHSLPMKAEAVLTTILCLGLASCRGPRGLEPVPPTLAQMQLARNEHSDPTRTTIDRSEMPQLNYFIHNSTQVNQTQINQTQINRTQFNTHYLNVFPR